MTGKLHIKTFGCQMNEYDSGKMAEVLRDSHGFEPTERAEEADVLLLNTCSVPGETQLSSHVLDCLPNMALGNA